MIETHPYYKQSEKSWQTISDVLEGEYAVKLNRDYHYLVTDDAVRYNNWLKRAVLVNYLTDTVDHLAKLCFSQIITFDLSSSIQGLITNSDGNSSLLAVLKSHFMSLLVFGRSGLLVDYEASGGTRPKLFSYDALDIVNWSIVTIGDSDILTMVMLREEIIVENKITHQFRKLVIEDGLLSVYLLDENGETISVAYPTGINGRVNKIPFVFSHKSWKLAPTEFFGLARLVITYFNVFADRLENGHLAGQSTLVINGLTREWYENVLNKTIKVGALGGLPLPVSADAKYITASANTELSSICQELETKMRAFSDRAIYNSMVERTATEVISNDNHCEMSAELTFLMCAQTFAFAFDLCGLYSLSATGKIAKQKKLTIPNDVLVEYIKTKNPDSLQKLVKNQELVHA